MIDVAAPECVHRRPCSSELSVDRDEIGLADTANRFRLGVGIGNYDFHVVSLSGTVCAVNRTVDPSPSVPIRP